jgi:NADH:ubiquinone oxidoreductase subunit 2 (subunit N)
MSPWITTLVFTRLSGLPPTSGFLAKWVTLVRILKASISILSTLILVIRSVNFFVYLRLITSSIMQTYKRSNKMPSQQNGTTFKLFLLTNAPVILILPF